MISICLPTRNRPHNLRRMWNSITATCDETPEVVLYVDYDDKASVEVADELGFKKVVGERKKLSACYNDAAASATGDILMAAGDDIVFRTPHWDTIVRDKFELWDDRIALVHCFDGYWGNELGTHPFISREWYETVGYLMPHGFDKWYTDNWLTDMATNIGRKVFLPNTLIEHMHPDFGKAEGDLTYKESVRGEYRYKEKRGEDEEKLRGKICVHSSLAAQASLDGPSSSL